MKTTLIVLIGKRKDSAVKVQQILTAGVVILKPDSEFMMVFLKTAQTKDYL